MAQALFPAFTQDIPTGCVSSAVRLMRWLHVLLQCLVMPDTFNMCFHELWGYSSQALSHTVLGVKDCHETPSDFGS